MIKSKLKTVASAIAIGLGALSFAGVAQAFPIYDPVTGFEDDNLEYLSKDTNGNKKLDVGDQLRGVVEFTKIFGVFGGGTTVPNPELTGLFEFEVRSKVAGGFTPTGIQLFNYIFAPTAAFQATYGAGAMIALFEGGGDLDVVTPNCATIAACEALAIDGAHKLTVGYGDADDIWLTSNAREDIGSVATLPSATSVGENNYFLSILTNNSGYDFAQQDITALVGACAGDCLVDVIGSGQSLGGQGLSNGYQIRSDIDAQIAFIPEPGALALSGLALIALGATRLRKKAVSA